MTCRLSRVSCANTQSMCQVVPYATVRRAQLLQAAAAMLPPRVQAAHAADILARHHQEALQPQVLRQVLQHAALELPDAVSTVYEAAGAQLVAMYAGPQVERAYGSSMPRALSFSQYWQELLHQQGEDSCRAPELQLQVRLEAILGEECVHALDEP